ncbi:probable serine/threonine-protein kinase YabT [Geomicrobium sp. JCM 19037]|uniref:serine/threonine protein kinase n=1 Tax=Geomicrobium sp. JCM 19037 TaxID=1460634 RepID=UPI00045F2363|nr:hypothetical protein [Geomicrobium sp. JCM 19037]GAK04887.1 probable serine/threonine-protein kinase YabT [Geomicrobium sp. JCM 19037]
MEKMNSTSKNEAPNLPKGQKITGKWNRNSYTVIRPLGRGATGAVFLVEQNQQYFALKVGHSSMSITSEVNVLKHFEKVQGQILGPSFVDADDLFVYGERFPFYVMEYLQGTTVFKHVERHGKEWAPVLIVQLLGDLSRLHRAGWVFGDLKPDNLIVTGPPFRIRWLDVGGTTIKGRAVKEYTEFFDRGYWGMGDRKADEQYDLFSAGMVFIHLISRQRFERDKDGWQTISKHIEQHARLRPYRQWLKRALTGYYTNADDMRVALMKMIQTAESMESKNTSPPKKKAKKPVATNTRRPKKTVPMVGIVDVILVISFLIITSILYLVGQLI